MPRNSSGTYALPTGNPVISDTFIQIDWANPTLSDIAQALTDSLDRNGRGTMLAPMKFADGTVAAPGIAFSTEVSTGIYRPGTSSMAVTLLGTEVARFTAAGLNVIGTLSANAIAGTFSDGTVAAPAIAFYTEPSTGMWHPAAGQISFAIQGAEAARITNAGISVADGALAAPAVSLLSEPTTGLWRVAPGVLGVSALGTEVVRFGTVSYFLKNAVIDADNPTLTITKRAAGQAARLVGSTGGIGRWIITLGDGAAETGGNAGSNFFLTRCSDAGAPIDSPLQINRDDGRVVMSLALLAGGSAPAPSLAVGEGNTGLFQPVAGALGVTTAGVERVRFSAGIASFNIPINLSMVNPSVSLSKTAAGQEAYLYGNLNGVARWRITLGDSSAESGGNAGSDFSIVRHADNGGIIGVPFAINRATGTLTYTGTAVFSGYVRAVGGSYIGNDTSFGVFIDGSYRKLGFAGNWGLRWDSAQGNLTYRNNGDATLFGLQADGNFTVNLGAGYQTGGGAWANLTSDVSTKEDIRDYAMGLAAIERLRPRTFRYRADTGLDASKTFVGLVAQEVQPVMPEMVELVPIESMHANGYLTNYGEGLLTINSTALTFALVNAVKELAARLTHIEGALH